MTTAHEKIRAGRLLPTAPFELLFDSVRECVIVTWPDLPAGLSLVFDQRESVADPNPQIVILSGDCPHYAWVWERLGADRRREIVTAVEAVYDDYHARGERIGRIYLMLEDEAADAH